MATRAGRGALWVVPPSEVRSRAAIIDGAAEAEFEGAAPPTFARQVRQALARLFDPVALQRSPLVERAARDPACIAARQAGGAALRRCLLEAVEALQPDRNGPLVLRPGWQSTRARRLHQLLRLRYVDGLDSQQVQEHLGLGKSHYYREHEYAVAAVSDLLHERWRDAEAAAPPPVPPLAGGTAWQLPVYLTSFVGRERESADLTRLLSSTRLLTLTGPGGTGKTRLALHVAARTQEAWKDGACVVELAPLADPALVPAALATLLGVREQPGRPLPATLADALRHRQLLLVLDNCEHLLDAAARLAETLLQGCPRLCIMATSREPLGLAGEVVWPVPPLGLPPRVPPIREGEQTPEALLRYEAIRLFVERASASQPSFALTPANAAAVTQVCARLDGIPLAIELAATRLRGLSVEQLAQRLETGFRLLTGGSRTALPRQQTLEAAIDWSYSLLSEPEKTLYERLSVFAGGWTLEAAEAVCAGGSLEQEATPELLLRLVDKSLVVTVAAEAGVERYRLLETVRQHGHEKLARRNGAEVVVERHADFYLGLAEQTAARVFGPEQVMCLARLEAEHDNLRAALRWWLAHRSAAAVGRAQRLVAACWPLWYLHGYFTEGREWLAAVRAIPAPDPTGAQVEALNGEVVLAISQGDFAVARTLALESVALARRLGNPSVLSRALSIAAIQANQQRSPTEARGMAEESLGLARGLGDRALEALAMAEVATAAAAEGDVATARRLHEQALTLRRKVGDPWGIARSLNNLGRVARFMGDHAAASVFAEEALTLHRRAHDKQGIAGALEILGDAACDRGDGANGHAYFEESLRIWQSVGDRNGLASTVHGLARVAATHAHWERAVRLAGAASALYAAIGGRPIPGAQQALEAALVPAGDALSPEAYDAAWSEGEAMTIEEAIACALSASAPVAEPAAEVG